MNINSRIDWKAGMAISARTFVQMDKNLAWRQQVANRASNGNQFGLIPFTEFKCQWGFVRNKLEIEHLSCMALLPSGKILHIDEKALVSIPLVYGDEYYLACGCGEGETSFEIEDVPFVRPEVTYGIYQLKELEGKDLLPIMKFKVNEGVFSIDEGYIPPCLHLSSDSRFQSHISRLAERIARLAEHPNLESGEGKRALQHYAYVLRNYDLRNRTAHFIGLTNEIAQAIDYYIVAPNTETPVVWEPYSEYDIVIWLNRLNDYAYSAETILDKVVLEDHSIDFEALKAQIVSELYERLHMELHDRLYEELKGKLYAEIMEEQTSRLTDYVNNRLKADLHDLLSGELSEELFGKLYKALYDSLFNALYVPEEKEEEEEFVPLI